MNPENEDYPAFERALKRLRKQAAKHPDRDALAQAVDDIFDFMRSDDDAVMNERCDEYLIDIIEQGIQTPFSS